MRHLGIPREFPVDIEIKAAVSALKHKYPALSVRGITVPAAVHSHRDIVRDIWRVERYRIADVGILRSVVTVKLPVTRNGYRFFSRN